MAADQQLHGASADPLLRFHPQDSRTHPTSPAVSGLELSAVATHKGPYDRLGESYTWLFDTWLPRQNLTPAGPCYEIYLNNPMNTKPEDLRTAIYIPIAG